MHRENQNKQGLLGDKAIIKQAFLSAPTSVILCRMTRVREGKLILTELHQEVFGFLQCSVKVALFQQEDMVLLLYFGELGFL